MAKPKIRFKGFSEDWEQRKVSEMCSIATGKSNTQDKIEDGEYPFYVRSPIIERSNKYLYDEEAVLTVGDGVGTGKVFHYVNGKYDLHQRCYRMYDFSDKLNAKYFFQVFSKMFYRRVMAMTAKTSVDSVRMEMIADMEIPVPSIEEQVQISRYLEDFDHLITLHQRKCDEIKTLKKYILQKMFPEKGKLVPEIRFDGFTEDWEQRKFSEFTWNAGKRNKEDLDLEPYAITNEHGFIKQSEAHDDFGYMKDTDRKAYNIVMPNSFAYNPARINVGSIGYYEGTENVIVSSLYEVFQTADYVDDRFLWHWFKSDEFPKWIERLQEGSVRLYFYYDKLCECQMLMPSVPEQKKIAEALDNLDNLITLHQHKCEELQKLKKFMLQNMFV